MGECAEGCGEKKKVGGSTLQKMVVGERVFHCSSTPYYCQIRRERSENRAAGKNYLSYDILGGCVAINMR